MNHLPRDHHLFRFPLKLFVATAFLITATLASFTQAGVALSSSRIVFNGQSQDAAIAIINTGSQPCAIQVWVDGDDNETEDNTSPMPFTAEQPRFELDAGKAQTVRVIRSPVAADLPTDRESVFFLNVQETPSDTKAEQDPLNTASLARIKLFYRPADLQGTANDAPAGLQWSVVTEGGKAFLQVANPGVFHVSFAAITLHTAATDFQVTEPAMLAPQAVARFLLPGFVASSGDQVEFITVKDSGDYSNAMAVPVAVSS